MAVAPILPFILLTVVSRSKCESSTGYNYNSGNGGTFGELLKPPPPPLSQIKPVPFHGGASRSQRQNIDPGYHYQPPPPPPPQAPTSDFKFPAPFYKQYNFNFVPPPQPFTTPSSSLFQKFSGWLFPSQETEAVSVYNNNIAPIKKDCNPCNLVPWIPVIRYDLGGKSLQQSLIPTYGPPSPTAQNAVQFRPRPFYSQNQEVPHMSTGIPHANYGPPSLDNNNGILSSTYGPPSPTHTVENPTSSTFIPSPSFGSSSSYNSVSNSYNVQSSTYGQSSLSYNIPSSTYGVPSSSYGLPSSTYGPPISTYSTPMPLYDSPRPLASTYLPVTPSYEPGVINNDLPQDNQIDVIQNTLPSEDLQLPKVSAPLGFKNSYGEPIPSTYEADIPFLVSATAAESSKIRTEVLPLDGTKGLNPNHSLALAKPAPFTLNRGRNIHTLQPVALPNLSVSPLPPIFNARPFRPLPNLPLNHALGIKQVQPPSNNVNIQQSLPLAEYTHSIDYPTSIVQSPVIDIDVGKISNQSKAYRNIPNGFIVDSFRDISSQASEDHIEATKSNQDSSFESTGVEVGNDLYEPNIPSDLKYKSGSHPSNHKNFADLRGVKDEDVDKYRTESNLQNIDSPLLYLKPGAPHKEYTNFVFSTSGPLNVDDYEIYDDISTTVAPKQSTFSSSAWDESRTDYSDAFSQPTAAQEDSNKPKIVQIIIPYTTGQQNKQTNEHEQRQEEWISTPEDDYLARKVPTNTENYYTADSSTESYTTPSTTTEEASHTENDNYESERLNTHSILNDLYDVKEPPFDIIKLQQNIDDWTEQEFSKRFKTQSQRTRNNGKYAKQIPDEYFTTISPVTNSVTPSIYNYDFYDHEGSSSIRHSVTEDESSNIKSHEENNNIDSTRSKLTDKNKDDYEDLQKLHIYTAASSFRSSTTTPAPWETIQTSISPLTKEKVYVVTSKPWRESQNTTINYYEHIASFESKKTNLDNEASASDNLPFQSPRFSSRPSFTTGENIESVKSDSSYGFSRNWHQRINDLENGKKNNNSTSFPEGSQNISTNNKEDTHPTTVTAEPPENVSSEKSVTNKSNDQ
ncbi:uncharacterized protein LOC134741495 isoform X1 [Cydia strobilella]|uniref:uncharacterized protein LOC134741495 isoform X1 n=1 Tax=Cydia strobilella TaxID=1100964 RepID=UPI003004F99B